MTEEKTEALKPKNPKDKWIPWYFVMFFAVIAILDGIFVYMAVSTQTGLVTDKAYERGLAYNELLDKARTQPEIRQDIAYEDGTLRWVISDSDGKSILDADVSAKIIRPVQDGYDFTVKFDHKGNGVYEAIPSIPLPGLWQAKLKGAWGQSQEFLTVYDFVVSP